MSVFYVDDMPGLSQAYTVRAKPSVLGYTYTEGSFNILGARVLGLTWANYLRLLRDEFNGTIYGKNAYYPYVIFSNKSDAERLANFLNKNIK